MTEHPTTRLQSFDEPAFDALRRTDIAAFVVTLADSHILAATPPCGLLGLRQDTPAPLSVKAVTRVMGGALGHPPRLERIRLPNAFVPRLFSCATLPSRLGPVVLFVEPMAGPVPSPEASPARTAIAHQRPTRFTWEMDEAGRVTSVSCGSGDTLSSLDVWQGKTLSDLVEIGAIRDAAPAQQAIDVGGTFANVSLFSGEPDVRRIEIGGVPLFDAMRRRIGWRGFGLVWPGHHHSPETTGASPEMERLAPNVVPLRGGNLSPRERSAFDEIARTLSDAIDGWPKGEGGPPPDDEAASEPETHLFVPVTGPLLETGSEAVPESPAAAHLHDLEHGNASTISWDDRLLDRLPIGLAVQQDGAIVFLNETLLAWLALEDLSAFDQAGGFGSLLTRDSPTAPLRLRTLSGPSEVDVRLIRATWRGKPAVIHVLKLIEPRPKVQELPEADDALARQAALDLFGFPMLVVNASGTLMQANAAVSALCGFPVEELAGEPFTLLFALESQKAVVALLDAALAGKPDIPTETLVARHRSGTLRTVEASASRATGTPPAICLALRVVAEAQPRPTSTVTPESVNLDAPTLSGDGFSDFARRVSHGVRSPLTGILGFVESVRASAFGPLGNSRYSRQAEAAALAAQQLLATLEDIEAVSVPTAPEPAGQIEIAPVISSALEHLGPSIKRRRQIVRSDVDADTTAALNRDVLAFLVRSVIEEAVRATPAGGQIHVSTVADGGACCILIRDGGPILSEPQIVQALSAVSPAPVSDRFSSAGRPFRMARLAAVLRANGGEMRLRRGLDSGMLCELRVPA